MFATTKQFFRKIAQSLWGKFESRAEIVKFVSLAVTFFLIICVYWIMRPVKDSVLAATVGMENQPWAKIFSTIIMLPLVVLYTRLISKFKSEKVFYILIFAYGLIAIIFMYFFMDPKIGLSNTEISPYRLIGWLWYVYVESFGSLLVALFWVIVTDTTLPESAKRGFPLIYMLGQFGNIVGPFFITAEKLGFKTSAPIVGISGAIMFLTGILLWLFMRFTPKDQLISYIGKDEKNFLEKTATGEKELVSKKDASSKKEVVGFFQGIKTIFSHGYLMGILFIIMTYEIVVMIFDYHFKMMVDSTFLTEITKASYLANYAVWTGVVATLCVVLGINNIQRKLGMFASLIIMPLLVIVAIFVFKFYPILSVALWIMVFSKGVNFALNQPTIKQLYIPTTKASRYNSQGWIEIFGARFAKTAGSMVNLTRSMFVGKYGALIGVNFFLTITLSVSFGLVIAWLFVAFYLAKEHKKALDDDSVVC
ncbi:MAG: Plastidic atp adp transporter [candidate division TM6 bacterium GW2011_GWF2_30_66]|jgi:AAA family ATP:ADP antiporter|nr:MAG: Plastidic atp adp transporter [candidate division TM6 bacterium GW2011_GWF2_30_66]